MQGGTNDIIERLKKGDASMMANLLAQQYPELDPNAFVGPPKPAGMPSNGPQKSFDFLGALSGAQSGMQAPKAQVPAPAHFAFGGAQLAKPPGAMPEGPSLSHLILGGR